MTKRPTQPAPDRSPRTLSDANLGQVIGGDSKIMANAHEIKKELIANFPR